LPQLPQHDPLNVPATRQQINNLRDELEAAQVVVNGVPVDIHERAEKRIQDAIDMWDALGQATLSWTMGDNSEVPLDKQGLIDLLASAKQARALRGLSIHVSAKVFKGNSQTSLRDLENWKASVLAPS
jgi:Domain of unknown function (DUF4376)